MRLLSPHLLALALALGLEVVSVQGHDNTSISPEVCESKTINYITHTLPQQCLRTSWSSANSTDQNIPTTATATATGSGDTVLETGINTAGSGPGQASAQPGAFSKQHGTEKKDSGSGEGNRVKEGDDDSEDLATSSFMSFEEWKAMMLQKSGQDPADLKGRKHHDGREGAESGSHDGLDSWGDDGEIALDFDVLSGKISEMAATQSAKSASASADASSPEIQEPALYDNSVAHYRMPKDAGKTCKERFSYASFDGGATVLKTSPGAKNAKAILVENKDSYMLFTCSQENKFVIVELSEDILVDTVVLANFEFFSSMIRSFRISVSDKYPVKLEKWKDIGTFQARNSRDIQSFLIENPKIWAKYIRIEFLSHYGNEYYCPVSLLRVHGTRMLDSWKDAEAGADDDEPAETITGPEAVPEHEVPLQNTTTPEPEPTSTGEHEAAPNAPLDTITHGISPWYAPLYGAPEFETCSIGTPTITGTGEAPPPVRAADSSSPPIEPIPSTKDAGNAAKTGDATLTSTAVSVPTVDAAPSANISANASVTSTPEIPASSTDSASERTQPVQHPAKSSITPPKPPPGPRPDPSSPKSFSKQPTNTNQNKTSTLSAAAASPTVQESFFKSISKRLQFLESNTTLSMQYIEEQSKFLHQALQKMERRQISRVDTFLDNLNNTVLGELRSVRQQYDQIWQSTVLALETQREHSDREIIALSSRLNLLADEVVFQKRMAIFQSVMLLCCLVLVLFSRGGLAGGGNGNGNGLSAEQWPMAVSASTSQFFNTYLGSPRWPPSSPQSISRGNTPTPTQVRRTSLSSMRHSSGGKRPLRPNSAQRAATGPVYGGRGPGVVPLMHSASYTDKVLPLTPTSAMFDCFVGRGSDTDDNDAPTPPRTSRQPPRIRVDEAEPEDDLVYEESGSRARGEDCGESCGGSSDGLNNGVTVGVVGSSDGSLGKRQVLREDDDDDDDDEDRPCFSSEEGEEDWSGGSASTSFVHGRQSSPDKEDAEEVDDNDDEGDDHGEGAKAEAEAEAEADHLQPSRPPPLTRSPLSELGGIMRKPLPALPEDPI